MQLRASGSYTVYLVCSTQQRAGSHLLKLIKRKISAIALHLCCIAFKVTRGRPIWFHILHIAREFGLGRLAELRNEKLARLFHFGCGKVAPSVLPKSKQLWHQSS